MIIEGRVEWKEYLKALYLHMRPRPWLKVVGIVLLSLFVLTYSYLVINITRSKATFSSSFAITVAFAYLILWFFVYLPYKAHKVYKQQKTLQALYKIEVVSDGLKYSSDIGNSHLTWDYFPKWKENKNLFLLYHSDVLFQMIPKRFFKTDNDISSFRDTLSKHVRKML